MRYVALVSYCVGYEALILNGCEICGAGELFGEICGAGEFFGEICGAGELLCGI